MLSNFILFLINSKNFLKPDSGQSGTRSKWRVRRVNPTWSKLKKINNQSIIILTKNNFKKVNGFLTRVLLWVDQVARWTWVFDRVRSDQSFFFLNSNWSRPRVGWISSSIYQTHNKTNCPVQFKAYQIQDKIIVCLVMSNPL